MIQKVLALLGYTVSTATFWKYIDRRHICSSRSTN